MNIIAQKLNEKQTLRDLISASKKILKEEKDTLNDLKEQFDRLDEELDDLMLREQARK